MDDSIWHYAHSDYAIPDHIASSPYAKLLAHNEFLRAMKEDKVITLLHMTTSLDKVLESGEILVSGGCLVGSFYCVMTHPVEGAYRPHNLGSYIFEHEVKRTLASKRITHRHTSPLLIELRLPGNRRASGVNYLGLGAVHLEIFNRLENSDSKLKKIATELTYRAARLIHSHLLNELLSEDDFFENLVRVISQLPILGYIYFEALTEYIMLFSQDEHSLAMASRGEINCWVYKDLVFQLQPQLLNRFDLGGFTPTVAQIHHIVRNMTAKGRIRVDVDDLLVFVRNRIAQLVKRNLLQDPRHMTGHIIDRLIRNPEYGDFFYNFDQLKAEYAWRYWNSQNVILPFNGLMPKGEVGINPASDAYRYSVHLARPLYNDGELYFEKDRELNLKITPKMIHPRHALMGMPNTK